MCRRPRLCHILRCLHCTVRRETHFRQMIKLNLRKRTCENALVDCQMIIGRRTYDTKQNHNIMRDFPSRNGGCLCLRDAFLPNPHQCNSFETNAIPQHACYDTIHHSNLTWRNRFALIIRTIAFPWTPQKEIQSPTPKPMKCSEPCSPHSRDLLEPYATTMVERGGRANRGHME